MNLTQSEGQTYKPVTSTDKDMTEPRSEMLQIMDFILQSFSFSKQQCATFHVYLKCEVFLEVLLRWGGGGYADISMVKNISNKPVVRTLCKETLARGQQASQNKY